jgi:flagellar motility protein MotE (MotC chaperone)
MKKLLIPVIIAVLAGVGGGSGFSYMRASKAYVADSTHRADSLKAHPPAKKDSAAAEGAEHTDSAPVVEPPPMTPADSIRAVEASRAPLREATKGLTDAPAKGTAAKEPAGKPSGAHEPVAKEPIAKEPVAKEPATKEGAAKAPAGKEVAGKAAPTKEGTKESSHDATASVANIVRDARNDALNTALPEQRLAKIFAAMSAKDAAKVMEQMPDADVRTIIGMMSDRSAAAILALFPASRAAAITKGAVRPAGTTP